jgi:hypothetical protein
MSASSPYRGMRHYQTIVGNWCRELFGAEIATNTDIRCYRFLEEAVELVQSLGCTRDRAFEVVNYVYNRPEGDASQEVGGTMITLAALCEAAGIDLEGAAWCEASRIESPEVKAKIRAKQASKIGTSPLPESAERCQVWVRGEKYRRRRDGYEGIFIAPDPHDGAYLIFQYWDLEKDEECYFGAEAGEMVKVPT